MFSTDPAGLRDVHVVEGKGKQLSSQGFCRERKARNNTKRRFHGGRGGGGQLFASFSHFVGNLGNNPAKSEG